jgi:hypothetical protein
LSRILAVSLGVVLIGVTLLNAEVRSGQTGPDEGRPGGRRARSDKEPEKGIDLPAPRKLKVAAGRGKALVYRLDKNQQRIPNTGNEARFQEAERELHWAVVTGVIDHRKVLASLGMGARPDRPSLVETYCRVELERSTLQKDGTWSRWRRVDHDAKSALLDNLPANDEERVSHEFLAGPLVDPLPWLTEGAWEGVDVEEFLPPEQRNGKDRRSARAPAPPPDRASPPRLMWRAFDFAAEPGRTYRYRARVAVHNPRGWRREYPPRHLFFGPWSEATNVVTVPSP